MHRLIEADAVLPLCAPLASFPFLFHSLANCVLWKAIAACLQTRFESQLLHPTSELLLPLSLVYVVALFTGEACPSREPAVAHVS
jgi:hypothetical protein